METLILIPFAIFGLYYIYRGKQPAIVPQNVEENENLKMAILRLENSLSNSIQHLKEDDVEKALLELQMACNQFHGICQELGYEEIGESLQFYLVNMRNYQLKNFFN